MLQGMELVCTTDIHIQHGLCINKQFALNGHFSHGTRSPWVDRYLNPSLYCFYSGSLDLSNIHYNFAATDYPFVDMSLGRKKYLNHIK